MYIVQSTISFGERTRVRTVTWFRFGLVRVIARFSPARRYASAVLAIERWLSVCLSVTCWYCVYFLDLLVVHSGFFFLTPAPIPNLKGNTFSGGTKYTGWENLAILDLNRRLSQKW